jgi:hypothetical protein
MTETRRGRSIETEGDNAQVGQGRSQDTQERAANGARDGRWPLSVDGSRAPAQRGGDATWGAAARSLEDPPTETPWPLTTWVAEKNLLTSRRRHDLTKFG